MSALQDLVGKVVSLSVRYAGVIYAIPVAHIMSVDTEWVSYTVPDGTQELIRQEDIVSIKVRNS